MYCKSKINYPLSRFIDNITSTFSILGKGGRYGQISLYKFLTKHFDINIVMKR